MTTATTIASVAAPLWRDGVEADQIIPAASCVRPAGATYGDALFAPWRYRPDGSEEPTFVLNREPYRRSRILVTGANFGYGSSREHAVWALRDFGIRAVVAVSFASIFRANCLRNGVVPVAVAADEAAAIARDAEEAPTELVVDLERQTVEAPSGSYRFELAPLDRELLLAGGDAVALVAKHAAEVEAFRVADRLRRPWVYETVERSGAA